VLVIKAGPIGASQYNRRSGTIGRGLSESRGSSLERKYVSTLVYDRPIY